MRSRACWILLFASVLLGGCSGPPKTPAPRPPDLPEPPLPPKLVPGTGASIPKGLLAGKVINKFDRPVPNASIQFVEVRDGGPTGAPLEALGNEQGYFYIPGLDAHQTYQLTARIAEGGKVLMAATVFARPPDPRLLIKISEDFVTPATPATPVLPSVTVPVKPKEPEEKKELKPAATLEQPRPSKVGSPPPAENAGNASEAPIPEAAPVRVPRPDLKIRTPPPLIIPPAPLRPDPAEIEAKSPYSSQRLPVPSCIMLTAHRIDNFALQQPDGQNWEFRRNRKGRLILLDFWYTQCGPCLRAIPHLNELHQQYTARGLEVIGVACESGPFDQRVQRVAAVRGRNDIRYRLLMNGDQGPLKPCPLCTQLGIAVYPTLKLIDERGEIVWESKGLSDRQLDELKREIERRLPLTR